MKEKKRQIKIAKENLKVSMKDIIGSFENDNKPLRIRSLKKKKIDQKNAQKILTTTGGDDADELSFAMNPMLHPFHLVTCTVEWYQQKTNQNEIIKIKESHVSYEEMRNKAP